MELGGGNLSVIAGNNIDAGVYYVENGKGALVAGGSIITNPTRDAVLPKSINPTSVPGDATTYLPTTLFLGKGKFSVNATGDINLGPIANAFLMPQSVNNSYWYKDYFSTYAPSDAVNVQSLGGSITLRQAAYSSTDSSTLPLLQIWENSFTTPNDLTHASYYQPWLRLAEYDISDLGSLASLHPPSLSVTDFSGDINIQGDYVAAPAPAGNISLLASGNINGLTQTGVNNGSGVWYGANINLSDADPNGIPSLSAPWSQRSSLSLSDQSNANKNGQKIQDSMAGFSAMFSESGSYTGAHGSLQAKQILHSSELLHGKDSTPLAIYALSGDISGLSLYSPKRTLVTAGGDITDVGFYIQNISSQDISMVTAGGDIVLYDPNSKLQLAQSDNLLTPPLQSGDIQISGPGTLEVLAGGNIDLGNNPGSSDSTLNVGITSIGNARNPALPFQGADVVLGAGVKLPYGLSSANGLMLSDFVTTVLAGAEGNTYLSELADTLTYSSDPNKTLTAASFDPASTQLSDEEKARLELQLFYIVLRDTGRNHNKAGSPGYGNYKTGEQAIATFFGNNAGAGDVTMWSQNIRTKNGGNISVFAPGGGISLASTASGSSLTPPGIVTEHGGAVNIYTKENVDIGIGRIFTLRGGDIMIWSNLGNIAAGSSAKTVATAPPTRVLIDPQSGNVETDLAGLATGGGIGVLATVADAPVGHVDLIAPSGVIDAGDAGIRSSGNLNLAATKVLNADNIAASGSTSGAPPAAPPPAAPNISGASAAAAAGAASTSTADKTTKQNNTTEAAEATPSIISVDVLGYGGGDGDDANSLTPDANSQTNAPQASIQ
jgi:hypothetical protein